MTDAPKLCRDCKYFVLPQGKRATYSLCTQENSRKTEEAYIEYLVTGEPQAEGFLYASTMRKNNCGPSGKYFEPKGETT